MTIDNRSSNQNYKLPNPQNLLADDAGRLIDAINAIDADVENRYTKAEVDQAIADLIDGSPDTLNTLNEIAAAIADDSDYFTTINTAIATKSNLEGGNSFSGDQTVAGKITTDTGVKAPYFEVTSGGKIEDVTGQYGSVKVTGGATTNYKGYAIEDSAVFMQSTSSGTFGLYDDTNNNWAIKHVPNADTQIYYDGTSKIITRSDGASIEGSLIVDSDIVPDTDNSGNVGTSANTFAGGQFTNLTVDSTLTVRGAIDLADSDVLRFGSSDDVTISYNSNNWLYTNFATGAGIIFQDNGTSTMRLEDSGIFRPETDGTGSIGVNTVRWADGFFDAMSVTGTVTVRGAIDLADNDVLRLGSGDDAQIVHDGSHLYIKMLADDDVIITDNNSSDAERFRFDVNEGRFYVDDNIYAGRSLGAYPKSGVHSITCYGRNSSSHPETTTWSAYAQMNADYRGQGNEATNEDTAMFYAVQQNAAGTDVYMHNMDVQGRYWAYGALYAGRGRQSTTGTAAASYKTGEHIIAAYSGSGSLTYIHSRNVADSSFVYHADVVSPRIEFQADGNGRFDGGADIGNADYAEMFEWLDGNPDDEDRRGYAVCLEGEFIRFATADDAPEELLGIVSAEPGVLGDSGSLNWQGQYLRDEYGRKLRDAVEYLVWNVKGDDAPDPENEHDNPDHRLLISELGTGSQDDLDVPDYAREADIRKTYYQLVENPDYDPEQTYVNRRARKEWDAIGMLGKLALRKDQPVGDRWRKLKPINDKLDLWLVR